LSSLISNPQRVAVVMSTYNGVAFVQEQIESILVQLPPGGRLLVRDDGSSDGTPQRIRAMADARISLTVGENIGFARSFLSLVTDAAADFDVVMLSDQDDVWLPDKISRACAALAAAGARPALYCSRQMLVDASLVPISQSKGCPRGPSFRNALCENIVTGCTSAMNQAAALLVCRHGDENAIFFHDWWFYLVISAFGHVIFDEQPSVLYRQHGRNVIGRGAGIRRHIATLPFLRQRSWPLIMYRQIENLRKVYWDELDIAQRSEIDRFFDRRNAYSFLRLLFLPVRRRQFLIDEFLLRALVLAELVAGRTRLAMDTPVADGPIR
jgi:glycosyltransferase involved in cell wall biosynthesis